MAAKRSSGFHWTLRRLTRTDAAPYHRFRQHQLAASPTSFTSTFEEERVKPISWAADRLQHADRPGDLMIGAFDAAGCLIGTAGLKVPEHKQARHKGTLVGVAVAAHAVGQGIGRALVMRVLEEARQGGLCQLVLTVTEGNRAAECLYRSCGFVPFGREPRAVIVAGRPITKVHMIVMLDRDEPAIP